MPFRQKDTVTAPTGGSYESPFVGPIDHTVGINVNLAVLTNKEIDARGYLKPGIPLQRSGALVGVSPAYVYGVTVEEIKVADDNEAGTLSALGTVEVAVATIAMVNAGIIEDLLGRALTADEVAGFARAGSTVKLIQ